MNIRRRFQSAKMGWLLCSLIFSHPALLRAQGNSAYDKVWFYSGSSRDRNNEPDTWERHKLYSDVDFEIAHERATGRYAVFGKWKTDEMVYEFSGTYSPKTLEIKAHLGSDPVTTSDRVDGNRMSDKKGFYMVLAPPKDLDGVQLHVTVRLKKYVGPQEASTAGGEKLRPDATTKFWKIVYSAYQPDDIEYKRFPECRYTTSVSGASVFDDTSPSWIESTVAWERQHGNPDAHAIYFSSKEDADHWIQVWQANMTRCGEAKAR